MAGDVRMNMVFASFALRWRGDFGDYKGAWFPANFCEEINVMIEPEQQFGEVCPLCQLSSVVDHLRKSVNRT